MFCPENSQRNLKDYCPLTPFNFFNSFNSINFKFNSYEYRKKIA